MLTLSSSALVVSGQYKHLYFHLVISQFSLLRGLKMLSYKIMILKQKRNFLHALPAIIYFYPKHVILVHLKFGFKVSWKNRFCHIFTLTAILDTSLSRLSLRIKQSSIL